MNVRPLFRNCPLKMGDELALAFYHPAIPKDADLKFKFEIAFSEPDIIKSEPVIATLRAMASVIDGIILDFKPLFDS